jgi:hypothetical protein
VRFQGEVYVQIRIHIAPVEREIPAENATTDDGADLVREIPTTIAKWGAQFATIKE